MGSSHLVWPADVLPPMPLSFSVSIRLQELSALATLFYFVSAGRRGQGGGTAALLDWQRGRAGISSQAAEWRADRAHGASIRDFAF